MKKQLFFCMALFISAFGIYKIGRAWDKRADGFTIEKITSNCEPEQRWAIDYTPEEIARVNEILDQSYTYLGRGFQCYVFVSTDGNYVLKFFRHQRLRMPVYFDWLPQIQWVKKKKASKEKELFRRKEHLFTSFKVAYEKVAPETGLIYVHLNKTTGQHPVITIVDGDGNGYELPLDAYEFVVQQKASLVKSTIAALMEEGREEEAKKRIASIFQLLVSCAKKGVADTDGALIRKDNLGFLGDRAIYIDAGKLSLKEKIKHRQVFAKDLRRLRPLGKWLEENYPTLAIYFEKQKRMAVQEF